VSALLQWEFEFHAEWMVANPLPSYGKTKVTNKLRREKHIDSSQLPDYVVRLDGSLTPLDWDPPINEPDNPSLWEIILKILGGARSYMDVVTQAQPNVGFDLELFNFDFFVTTNLLLPNRNVVKFDTNPGARFPWDLYLVGRLENVDEVRALQNERRRQNNTKPPKKTSHMWFDEIDEHSHNPRPYGPPPFY
jgi:hypothetical protein